MAKATNVSPQEFVSKMEWEQEETEVVEVAIPKTVPFNLPTHMKIIIKLEWACLTAIIIVLMLCATKIINASHIIEKFVSP